MKHEVPTAAFLAAALIFGCAHSAPAEEIDLAPLQSLDRRLAGDEFGLVDGMLVLHKGRIVFERAYRRDYRSLKRAPTPENALPPQYYDTDRFPFYQGSRLHTLQSVTKSVTSAVVGVALFRKDLPNLDIPVMDFLGERATDPRMKAIKLEHVLTMTVGNDWDESSRPYFDAANPASAMEKSDDWLKFVIDRPMLHDPGTVFSYSSGSSLLLSAVLQKATGMAVEQYAAKYLFEPLGIKEYHWARVPRGYSDTEGGLYLAPRDLAKIGLLYLRDGVWDGQRILPEGWVAASLSPRVANTGRRVGGGSQAGSWAYGYQWWLRPIQSNGRTSYVPIGRGFGGQVLILLPEDELIGVFNAWNITPGSPAVPVELYLDSLRRAAARLHDN